MNFEGLTWRKSLSEEEEGSRFIETVSRARFEPTPGDFAVATGVCPHCNAPMVADEVRPHLSDNPKSPAFKAEWMQLVKAWLDEREGHCPACGKRTSPDAVRAVRQARITTCEPGIHVVQLSRNGGSWSPPDHYAMQTAEEWHPLGSAPTSAEEVRLVGRAFHPIEAIFEAVDAYVRGGGLVSRLISSAEACVVGTREEMMDGPRLAAAAAAGGLPGRYIVRGLVPEITLPGAEALGLAKEYRRRLDAKGVGVSFVFSASEMVRSLGVWGRMYSVQLQPDAEGRVRAQKGKVKIDSKLGDLADQAMARCFTVNESTYLLGFQDLPMLAESVAIFERIQSELADADAARKADRPWHRCQTCGKGANVRKRVVDEGLLNRSFPGPRVDIGKGRGSVVVLMKNCPKHLAPLGPSDLASWNLTPASAQATAEAELARDSVTVVGRILEKRSGEQAVLMLGAWAASVATDAQWIRAAVEAFKIAAPGPYFALCYGEHAAALGAEVGEIKVGTAMMDLKKAAKAAGLPPPPITPFYKVRELGAPGQAAGHVLVGGLF